MSAPSRRLADALFITLTLSGLPACKDETPKPAPAKPTASVSEAARTPSPASAAQSAPPTAASVSPAHGDHDPRNGGVVFMVSDVHYEVVLDKSGLHKVFVSDATRNPIKASTFSEVALTVKRPGQPPENVVLSRDPGDAAWSAQGKPIDDAATTAQIAYSYLGSKQTTEVGLGGAGHGEGVGGGPHGGVLQSHGDGQLELLATAAGSFQIWILDAKGAPKALAGETAQVKVALPGYAEVTLAPMGNHLHGQGAPIPAEHAAAIVILTAGGKSETARFALHLEGPGREHGGGHGQGHGHGHGHGHEHGQEKAHEHGGH